MVRRRTFLDHQERHSPEWHARLRQNSLRRRDLASGAVYPQPEGAAEALTHGSDDSVSPNYAPSQRPAGCQLSVLSQITFIVAVIGMARISPIAPHSQPQNSSATVTARAFRWTRFPTSAGISTLMASRWKKLSMPATPRNGAICFHWLRPMTNGGNHASIAPK